MLRKTVITLLVLGLSVLPVTALAGTDGWVSPIDITGHVPPDVRALSDTIIRIGEETTRCVRSGQPRTVCVCERTDDLERLRSLYQRVISEHPEWADAAVAWRDGNTQRFVSFVGVRAQLRLVSEECGTDTPDITRERAGQRNPEGVERR